METPFDVVHDRVSDMDRPTTILSLDHQAATAVSPRAPRDGFGRTIDYLRVSVTDHCNLRCVYCMPLTGLSFVPSEQLLTPQELSVVARAAAVVGFRKIRITGGEPTLRADLVDIVARFREIEGIDEIAMTTNGILLPRLAKSLRAAGLDRVNIHVDSLHPDRVAKVMRFASLSDIRAGITAAQEAGFKPIKLNSVVVRDYNEQDVVELAGLTLEHDWHVRFVELMPLGDDACARLSRSQYVSNQETRSRIEAALGSLSPLPVSSIADESRNFKLPRGRGVVGFISPVSEPYCDRCNRMRLTADGKFHVCLLHDAEFDVRSALRNGGAQGEVEKILTHAIGQKPMGHRLHQGVSTGNRSMFQIGG